jgi:hypothetical protein
MLIHHLNRFAFLGSLLGAAGLSSACESNDGGQVGETGGGSTLASGGKTSSGGGTMGGAPSDGGQASGGSANATDGGAGGDTSSASGGIAAGGDSNSGGQAAGGNDGESGGSSNGADCTETTGPKLARAARSLFFSGTDADYAELYDQPCTVDDSCVAPCTARGGTMDFCKNSICIDSDPDYCLPPTKWRAVELALGESTSVYEAAVTSLSVDDGTDQDRLILDDFGLEVPNNATVVGIAVTIRHAGGGPNEASDQVVRIVKGGVVGESAREKPGNWPIDLTDELYGGPSDLWGETWTPADVNSKAFGVAVAALPVEGAGRAYVDTARVEVTYSLLCE